MQQGRTARVTDMMMRLADADLAEMLHKGYAGDLSEPQFWRFRLAMRALHINIEDSYLQHKASLLGSAAFQTTERGMLPVYSQPGVRALWQLTRGNYSPDYAAYVDRLMKETATGSGLATHTQWKAELAAITGAAETA